MIKPTSKPIRFHVALGLFGIAGLLTGCRDGLAAIANAQTEPLPTPTRTPLPSTTTPTVTSTPMPLPTVTPWPSPTAWPTVTPWSTPSPWRPANLMLPTLIPLPVVPSTMPVVTVDGAVPINYAPPSEVDVAGTIVLRWEYPGLLAEDEFFDIKIKPYGSESSAFVDWTKSTEYELRPWSGWTSGVYTWQIGIIKGYLNGKTKNFVADTGRDSAKFIIKWHDVSRGSSSGGGGGGSTRSGGS